MREKTVCEEELSKEDYAARLAELEPALFHLEWKAKEANIPTLILLEGFVATGKGEALRTLTEHLDPRSLRVHPFRAPRSLEREYPWLWRYWMRLPNYGEMAVFDTSWYRQVIDERVEGALKPREREARLSEINQLERLLIDDGMVLVKLWFHIGRKEQARRLRRAERDERDFWEVTAGEWAQNDDYKKWKRAAQAALEATHSERAPWTTIDATNPRRSRVRVLEAISAAMQARLAQVAPDLSSGPAPTPTHNGQVSEHEEPRTS